jgi:hypothetical protein
MPDLTGLPVLDVVIGLAFVFFLLAVLASAIQELVAGFFGLRARMLEQGLRNMLASGQSKSLVDVDAFYHHPLIDTLYRGKVSSDKLGKGGLRRTKGPSYVSPTAFATFLLDQLTPADGAGSLRDIEAAIEKLPSPVQDRLSPLVKAAGDDVAAFRQSVEVWYDNTMARVSGWYKRKTQVILLLIGAALVLALNANALTIADRLWKDQAVRAAVVQQANQTASQPQEADRRKRLNSAADDVANVSKLGAPIGWSGEAKPKWSGSSWTTTIGGWLLTILAISLGAPFWFDALGRLSRLRSSGKPETPLPATGSGKPGERVSVGNSGRVSA